MSTPTEPTTPQPKPAGLRTCFHCGTDLSSLPDDVFCPKCLPVPATPHAAETGVPNATVFACSQCGCDIHFAPFVGCEKCKPVAQIYRAEAKSAAAETVGTGDMSLKALWAKFHAMWGDARAGRTYCKDDWMEMQAMVNKLTATPPALEALESLIWEERVGNGVALMCCKGGVDIVAIGDQDGSDLGESLGFAPTLAAALNAVLPPAKGGDGV